MPVDADGLSQTIAGFRRRLRQAAPLVVLLALLAIAPPACGEGLRMGGIGAPGLSSLNPPINRRGLCILGGLGAAALFAKRNEDTDGTARMLDRSAPDLLLDAGNEFGNGLVPALGAAGLLLSGRALDDRRLSSAGSDLARSFLWSGAIVLWLKQAIPAERPDGRRHAFPSGHAASAFAMVPVAAKHLGPLAGASVAALATCTALGRIEDRRHDLGDVLFGVGIGLVVGLGVTGGDEEEAAESRSRFLNALSMSPRGLGLSVSF